MNLDPFTHYTDDKLWNALEQTGLKAFVQSLEEGLEYMCSEGGENLRSVCGLDLVTCKYYLCSMIRNSKLKIATVLQS